MKNIFIIELFLLLIVGIEQSEIKTSLKGSFYSQNRGLSLKGSLNRENVLTFVPRPDFFVQPRIKKLKKHTTLNQKKIFHVTFF